MSVQVTINGTTYSLPTQGTNPPWGEDLSDIIQALITVANNSLGSHDITTTTFTVANNTSSVANITGLSFDVSAVRSAIIQYSIYRSSSTTEKAESGFILATYKSTAGTWEVAQYSVGDAAVPITITSSGQAQYTSSNFSGTSYTGKMVFSAKAFEQ